MDALPRTDVRGSDVLPSSNCRLRILGFHDGNVRGNGASFASVLLPCGGTSASELCGAARLCISHDEGERGLHSGRFLRHDLFCRSEWR